MFGIAAQLAHKPVVRANCLCHGGYGIILNSVVAAVSLYYLAQCGVVYMAYPRKKMMFDLEIESANKPGDCLALWGKV